jgi:hypothetical protein
MGIEELVESLSRSEKRALESHLTRLMTPILEWHAQPQRRSRSGAATIRQARRAIARLQEDTPQPHQAGDRNDVGRVFAGR